MRQGNSRACIERKARGNLRAKEKPSKDRLAHDTERPQRNLVAYELALGSAPNLLSPRVPSLTAKIKLTIGTSNHHPL